MGAVAQVVVVATGKSEVIRRWGKWHWGVRNDPKLRMRCTPEERWCWAALFDLALQKWAEGAECGVVEFLPGQAYAIDELAEEFGCNADVTQRVIVSFEKLHMIERSDDGRILLVNMKKRQEQRNPEEQEAVNGRVRRHRNSRKQQEKDGTQCNADETHEKRNTASVSVTDGNDDVTGEERRGDIDPPISPKGDSDRKQAARRVLARIVQHSGRPFRAAPGTLRPIMARLADTLEADCVAVVDFMWKRWGSDEKMGEHYTPTTLFRPANFEKYLAAAKAAGAPAPHAELADFMRQERESSK